MVTSVTNLGRSGVSDWLVQRVTSVILLAYFGLIGVTLASGTSYAEWSALFDRSWMRVFSLMALLSLAAHAWIGIWAVLTDYLTERLLGPKGNTLRVLVQIAAGLVIFVYVIWGIQILWGK